MVKTCASLQCFLNSVSMMVVRSTSMVVVVVLAMAPLLELSLRLVALDLLPHRLQPVLLLLLLMSAPQLGGSRRLDVVGVLPVKVPPHVAENVQARLDGGVRFFAL